MLQILFRSGFKVQLRAESSKGTIQWLRKLYQCLEPEQFQDLLSAESPKSFENTLLGLPKAMEAEGPPSAQNNGETIINVHGWLEKRGYVNRQWQPRYFAMWNSRVLYYFKTIDQCEFFLSGDSSNNTSQGFINLADVVNIQWDEGSKVIQMYTHLRTWYFRAANVTDAEGWHKAISLSLARVQPEFENSELDKHDRSVITNPKFSNLIILNNLLKL